METRIIATYLIKIGLNDFGDREVDLDEYAFDEVNSIESGVTIIKNNQPDGCGNIIEQSKNKFGNWEDDVEHHVDHGQIYDKTIY